MGNNGGVGEIISHALLSLAEMIMHLSCISHTLLSLAKLMLSSHWLSWSCISYATTKVQP